MGQVSTRRTKASLALVSLLLAHSALTTAYYLYAHSSVSTGALSTGALSTGSSSTGSLSTKEVTGTAAVVFFHDFGPKRGLDTESHARVTHAKNLFNSGFVESIVTVGGRRAKRPLAGAEHMRDALIAEGLPEGILSAEASSYDTHSNLKQVSEKLRGSEVKRLVLVSSPLHLFRISLLGELEEEFSYEFSPHTAQSKSLFETFVQIQREWSAIVASTLLSKERYDAILHYLRREKELI